MSFLRARSPVTPKMTMPHGLRCAGVVDRVDRGAGFAGSLRQLAARWCHRSVAVAMCLRAGQGWLWRAVEVTSILSGMPHLEHGDATMRLVSLRGVAHPAVVGGGGEVMIDAQRLVSVI